MDPAIVAALIVAGFSFVTSIVVAVTSARTTVSYDERIRLLDERIGERVKERDARRDYEYEARKRLYDEFEPQLFPLLEAAETALHTVFSLARTAQRGEIGRDGVGWLDGSNEYYLRSTVFRLLSPLAHILLLRRRLTMVDLRLDPGVARQYLLCKCLAWSFTDDFELAESAPFLHYDPHGLESARLRQTQPDVYVHQGIPVGFLDSALRGLIVESRGKELARVMSFGEFDEMLRTEDDQNTELAWVINGMVGFHPATRPVAWRILIAQFLLYRSLIREGKASSEPGKQVIPADMLAELDWRRPGDGVSEEEAVGAALQAARSYVDMRWSEFAALLGV